MSIKFEELVAGEDGIVFQVLSGGEVEGNSEQELVVREFDERGNEIEKYSEMPMDSMTQTEVNESDENVAMFVESKKGTTVLQFNGHRYRKMYKNKNGIRWNCSSNKNCSAFVYMNDSNEITMAQEQHDHLPPLRFETTDSEQTDTAVVITSRKGKEMLLFRQYTYRKQYDKGNKSRWVCSTLKNCKACVFTDKENFITSAFEEHCHDPPKYYLKPDHVLGALREPIFLETD